MDTFDPCDLAKNFEIIIAIMKLPAMTGISSPKVALPEASGLCNVRPHEAENYDGTD
jgi:hypothetical protein